MKVDEIRKMANTHKTRSEYRLRRVTKVGLSGKGKTLLTPRHSLSALSEPRPGRTLEFVEAN